MEDTFFDNDGKYRYSGKYPFTTETTREIIKANSALEANLNDRFARNAIIMGYPKDEVMKMFNMPEEYVEYLAGKNEDFIVEYGRYLDKSGSWEGSDKLKADVLDLHESLILLLEKVMIPFTDEEWEETSER